MEGYATKDCSPNKDILNRRLEDGERVYLSEVYEMLGIERNIFNRDADYIFWQKVNGQTKLMTIFGEVLDYWPKEIKED